jgi:hypothetical protein
MTIPVSPEELINNFILQHGNTPYDKVKAHEYYIRTRHLKGRHRTASQRVGGGKVPMAKIVSASQHQKIHKQTVAKLARLTLKLRSLQNALQEAEKALRDKEAQQNRPAGQKTTAKQKQQAKQYRDTHKAQIKAKEKQSSGGSGGSSSSSSTKPVSQMSVSELTDRVHRIKKLITSCTAQIKATNDTLHS